MNGPGAKYGMVGSSPEMIEVYKRIDEFSKYTDPVLIMGETGTGKELVAKAIHGNSNIRDNLFVAVNCGAIPDTLFESEMFGYKKGAFTGANKNTPGLIKQAEHGTLFLDELLSLSKYAQTKLLRVMQERTYRPLGYSEEQKMDVRVITATPSSLDNKVNGDQSRAFDEALFYRFDRLPIYLPALRKRGQDKLVLASHFIRGFSKEKEVDINITQPAKDYIETYKWPGNVRQMENKLRVACIFANRLQDKKITLGIMKNAIHYAQNGWNQAPTNDPTYDATVTALMQRAGIPFDIEASEINLKNFKRMAIDLVEREIISSVLKKCDYNRSKASKILKISYKTLLYRISELDIIIPKKGESV